MLRGDLSSFSLGEIFQSLAINNHTGTLKIVSANRTEKLIFFSQGEISLFSHGSAEGLRIGEVLVRNGALTNDDLRKALAEQKKTKELLGRLLMRSGLIDEDDIRGALRTKIQEEVYDLFLWTEGVFEFHMGSCPEELFDEMQKSVSVSINTNSVIMEGLRRLDEWQVLNAKIQTFDEIFIHTDEPPEELAGYGPVIHELIDGVSSVAELFPRCHITRFGLCSTLVKLWGSGHIRPLTPTECQKAAKGHLAQNEYAAAIGFLKFATQTQPDDAGLQETLAAAFAGEGKDSEARIAYLAAARAYAEEGNLEHSANCADYLVPGTELGPQDLALFFRVFTEVGNLKKAIASGTQLATRFQATGEFERATQVLESIVKLSPDDLNLKIQISSLLEKCGEIEQAKAYLEEVADVLEESKKYRELVKVLRLSLAIDPNQQHLKEKVTAVQALIEKIELRRKRRLTFVGSGLILLLICSVAPVLYEIKAREYFQYAQRMEQVALSTTATDFHKAKEAYAEFLDKYALSTKVSEAQASIHRLTLKAAQLERKASTGSNVQASADAQVHIERIKNAFATSLDAARVAEDSGDVQEANALYNRLRKEYSELPASQLIHLPAQITSDPPGARLFLDGKEVGKTPSVYYYEPGSTLEVKLARRNCDDLIQTVELHEQWQLHFVMERKPLAQFTPTPTIQQPVVTGSGKLMFVPSRDGKIYAVDALRQEVTWVKEVGRFGDRISDLAVHGNRIYFVTVSGKAIAMDGRTGEPVWITPIDGSALAAPTVSPDGAQVALGSTLGTAYLLDARSGKTLAKVRTENRILASPAFVGEIVVIGSTDNHLYGYSIRKRELQFVWELSSDILSIHKLGSSDVLVLTGDARLHRLSLDRGGAAWSQTLEELPSAPLAVTPNVVLAGTTSGRLLALDPESGETRWSLLVGPGSVGGISVAGNRAFFGLDTGYLAVARIDEERVAWKYRTGSPVIAPPIVLDRILCVGSLSGKTWIFEVLE